MQKATNKQQQQWCNFEQLSDVEKKLFKKAIEVRENSQAPYSNFHVGAALVTQDGNIYSGCNVERCTLTQTTHAEQNAIDSMISAQGSAKIQTIVFIAAPTGYKISWPPQQECAVVCNEPAVPCGHCLQIIWENCNGDPHVKIMTLCTTGQVYVTTIGHALPIRFGPMDLGVKY